ncbi:MAG: diaminopimelate epimerase [Candidatus Omnitrophota bacterium]
MKKLNFVKMTGAGNDFVVIDAISRKEVYFVLAKRLCERRTGIGADGLLVIEKSKKADFMMRIFNSDGSEADMCGNGLRCAVAYMGRKKSKIETRAGIYHGEITDKDIVKVTMVEPRGLRQDVSIKINERFMKVNFINTGVPHAVVFVQGIDEIDVNSIGREIRYHEEFRPAGANVDFVEIVDDKNIKMRTYERGVEGETLACGTGATASVLIASYKLRVANCVNVRVKGGLLKVYFKKKGSKISDVYLEGEAREVFQGGFYV